jgi:hypothetical protein
MRSSPGSVANSRACAVAVLAAGMLLLPLGCARKPDAGNRGNAPPPARPAAGRVGRDKPRVAGVQRPEPDVDISMILTFGKHEVGIRDEFEVRLGSEVAVREDVVWNHAESVNQYTRSWGVVRCGANSAEKAKKVRTDTGLVVIGGDTTAWDGFEVSRLVPRRGGGEVEQVRQYKLRFTKVGSFQFAVEWCAGIAEPREPGGAETVRSFADSREFLVRVVDAPQKAAKPRN